MITRKKVYNIGLYFIESMKYLYLQSRNKYVIEKIDILCTYIMYRIYELCVNLFWNYVNTLLLDSSEIDNFYVETDKEKYLKLTVNVLS